jgi:hypothetical protein
MTGQLWTSPPLRAMGHCEPAVKELSESESGSSVHVHCARALCSVHCALCTVCTVHCAMCALYTLI